LALIGQQFENIFIKDEPVPCLGAAVVEYFIPGNRRRTPRKIRLWIKPIELHPRDDAHVLNHFVDIIPRGQHSAHKAA